MSRNHRFVEPTTKVCARGCTARNRHATDCEAQHTDECDGCLPREAAPGAVLCRGCVRWLERIIAEMPALAHELHRGMTKPATPYGQLGGANDSPDFAKQRRCREHIGQIAYDLAWLVKQVAEDRGLTMPTLDTMRDGGLPGVHKASVWLIPHVPWMAQQMWVDETLSALQEARWRAFQLADIPRDKVRVVVGPCPERDDIGTPCPGQIWAFIPRNEHPFTSCDACEKVWPSESWRRLGKRMGIKGAKHDRWLVRIPDAAMATGVPERTIRRWVQKGWVRNHSDTVTSIVDVVDVEELRDRRGEVDSEGIMADPVA